MVDLQGPLGNPQSNIGRYRRLRRRCADLPRRRRDQHAHQRSPDLLGGVRQQRPHGEAGPDCDHRRANGDPLDIDTACYIEVTKPSPRSQPPLRRGGSRGDPRLVEPQLVVVHRTTPVTIDQKFYLEFQLAAVDRGPPLHRRAPDRPDHRAGNYCQARARQQHHGHRGTIDTKLSKVTLPIVGGYPAAVASRRLRRRDGRADAGRAVRPTSLPSRPHATGTIVNSRADRDRQRGPNPAVTCDPVSGSKFAVGTTTVTCVAKDVNGNTSAPKTFKVVVRHDVPVDGTVGGAVPATLSLTLGTPAQFGAFTPGVTRTYLAST